MGKKIDPEETKERMRERERHEDKGRRTGERKLRREFGGQKTRGTEVNEG